MVASIVISLILAILFTWIAYDYSRFKARASFYEQKMVDYENKFLQVLESEHQLRLMNNDLQDRLNQAIVDPVTDLLGWHLFEDRLNQGLKESVRYHFTLAVMFIDVDEFKVINNALGYEVGDALLREIAKRLQQCIRQVDSISRFSKDVFAVMLPQLGKPETAAIVAQRMLQAIAQPFHIGAHELYVSVCIGITVFPTDSKELTTLLRSADHALQLAKEKGKQSYQFYQERMNVNSKRELAISNGLRRDSISQEFVTFFQPILDVRNQSIFCMEAILNWQNPELGLIYSQELYSYANRQGKLSTITEWLLRNACKQFLYWKMLGFTPQLIALPINIKQLENTNFIYRLSQILQEVEFKPEWLLLEIQYDAVQIQEETMDKAFNMLNYMGIQLCINDFGASFFTLRDLKNYKVQYLKLDPSLVEVESKQSKIVVEAVVQMAKELDIAVIAAGITTAAQGKLIKELGCYLLQGSHVAEPIAEKEIPAKVSVQKV